jgi:ferredoxin
MATCDGSGEYYIVVDSDKCNGCGKCVKVCPQKALVLVTEFIDLEDKTVAAVSEEHRKKIKLHLLKPANLTKKPWIAKNAEKS